MGKGGKGGKGGQEAEVSRALKCELGVVCSFELM